MYIGYQLPENNGRKGLGFVEWSYGATININLDTGDSSMADPAPPATVNFAPAGTIPTPFPGTAPTH